MKALRLLVPGRLPGEGHRWWPPTAEDVAFYSAELARCHAWIKAWSPAVPLRWCARWCWRHRLLTVCLIGLAAVVLGAARAGADPSGTGASVGDGNPFIAWMGIKDSHGVPVAKYTLTLNEGSAAKPIYAAIATVDSVVYEIYLVVTTTALWLIKFVLEFKWLGLFAEPFKTIGGGIESAMDKYGLAATALAVLAIIVACTALAGKTAKAFSNIAMGLLMVGVAATIFANPLAELVGSDGLLAKGRDTGMQIATSVSGGKGTDTDAMVAQMADRFLRSPTQMINFGKVSDSISRTCQEAWSNGIKNGHGDNLKDDMQLCDKKEGQQLHDKSMANPASILAGLVISEMLGVFLVAFACYFIWHVVRAAVHALLFAAIAPAAFAVGVIPGGPQTFALKTVLDCLMAFAAMVVYTAAFGAYNVVLDRIYQDSGGNVIKAMFLTALVLAFGFAFFGPLRRMFDRQRDTMAAKLSGGGGASAGGGRGLLQRAADVSRLRNDLRRKPKPDDDDGDNPRNPPRIDSESDSASASGGGGPSGGGPSGGGPSGGGGGGGGAGASSGGPSGGGGGEPDSGATYLDGDAAPVSGGRRSSVPAGEPAYADSGSRGGDRLAAAMRLYRATRGDASPPAGADSSRHALSEAA